MEENENVTVTEDVVTPAEETVETPETVAETVAASTEETA